MSIDLLAVAGTPKTTGANDRPVCRVLILPPRMESTIAYAIWAQQYGAYLPGDIISVTTHDDLAQPFARFSITFAPRAFPDGTGWFDQIPKNSLVVIEMQRDPDRLPMPLDDDPCTIVGLVRDVGRPESFSGPQINRMVQVSGECMGSIIARACIYYNEFLNMKAGDPGSLASLQVLQSDAFAVLGKLSWAPNLVEKDFTPLEAIETILNHFLFDDATGVIHVNIPGYNLGDLLTFGSKGHWGVLDPTMKLPEGDASPMARGQTPVWSYLERFVDKCFHEFFVRVESGKAVIHFRPKPFSQFPMGDLPVTRFDQAFPSTLMSLRTIYVHRDDIIDENVRTGSDDVFNLFFVNPAGSQMMENETSFKAAVPPEICGDPTSPSFVGTWGLRPMEVSSPYMAIMKGAKENGAVMAQAILWAKALRAWYEWNPSLVNASITVPGRGTYKKGQRLVISGGGKATEAGWLDREYYIEGVSQNYDNRTGTFISTLRCTRGWDITPEAIPGQWCDPIMSPIYFIVGGGMNSQLAQLLKLWELTAASPAFGLAT